MKKCKVFIPMICGATEGKLSDLDKVRWEEHLGSCADCTVESGRYSDMRKKIVAAGSLEYDRAMEDRIISRIREIPQPPSGILVTLRPLLAAGLAVFILFLGIFVSHRHSLSDSKDPRLVNGAAIQAFVLNHSVTVNSFLSHPTVSSRYELAKTFYDYMENLYGYVDADLFKTHFKYLESNLNHML